MPARHVHFWFLTATLRKIMTLPVGISSSGSVSFWLINISHHINLSSSKEMMQNENRQIKIELCVVIKAVTLLPFCHLNTTNTAKKKKTEAPQWVSAAPCSSNTAWIMTAITINVSFERSNFVLEVLQKCTEGERFSCKNESRTWRAYWFLECSSGYRVFSCCWVSYRLFIMYYMYR